LCFFPTEVGTRAPVSGCPAESEVPTLVINRAADPLGPAANGRILAERIAGACSILCEGVGHIPEVEREGVACNTRAASETETASVTR
jgi:pimeloyl-ACP methyl ester carboxylesterase